MNTAAESVAGILVRACTDVDVDELHRHEPPGRNYARGAAERQEQGDVVFLVVRLDGVLVGAAEVTSAQPPELKNLSVTESARGQGAGKALIEAAEGLVEARHGPTSHGPRELAIGVGIENPRAAALYERMGYVRTGVMSTTTYDFVDDDGETRTATERDEELIKRW